MKTNVQNCLINNFKIVGKKLIIAVLLVVTASTFAQQKTKNNSDKGSREMKSPAERVEAQLKKMTKELTLDANQQAKIKEILVLQSDKMEAIKADRMANKDSKPSKEDRAAMKVKRETEKTEMDNSVKAVLNPTQFEKYKAMEEANKAKMKERMGNNTVGE